jgi:uncharacterized protein YkwD
MRGSIFFISIFCCLFTVQGFAQPSGKALEIINLVNEARSNPKQFLSKHKTVIQKCEPKFVTLLEKSTSMEKVVWDKGLEDMAKAHVNGNLNPEYKGSNSTCGLSSSNGSGFSQNEAILFVCDLYTNVLDPDIKFFGFYANSKSHAIYFSSGCDTKKIEVVFTDKLDTSKVDFTKINTGKGVSYLNEMDAMMIREINFVRHYPQIYAVIIQQYLVEESKTWGVKKAEYDAAMELISELKNLQPLSILKPFECVYKAAKIHALDCKSRGFTDHTGSDDSSPFDRIEKQCKNMNGNENIVGGALQKGVRAMVISLLIDSGISSRGHRYNILNPDWKYVGCYGYAAEKTEHYTMYYYIQNFATDNE